MATQIVFPDGVIVLDSTPFISPQYPSRATQHPIEDGSSISDHIVLENVKIELEGVVSDSVSFFGLVATQTTPKEAFQRLRNSRDRRELVSINHSLTNYENLVITNMSFPRDANTGSILDIRLSFEQIRIADAGFVQQTPVTFSDEISDQASSTETLGSQPTSEVPATTNASVLQELVNAVAREQ